jgi:hypothetical protein
VQYHLFHKQLWKLDVFQHVQCTREHFHWWHSFLGMQLQKIKFTHWVSRKYSYCLHVWWVWKNLLCGWHRTWRLCNVTGFMNSFESLICCSLYSARGGRTYYGTLILPSRKRQNMLAKFLRDTRAESQCWPPTAAVLLTSFIVKPCQSHRYM